MTKMPLLFVGHGSPMNAIEKNAFTKTWVELAGKIPEPKAILSISAHWTTSGTRVSNSPNPRTIYDMFGFPKELYEVQYQPPGAPEIAANLMAAIPEVLIDNTWGIDHGTWSVLKHFYPKANVPVLQLSLDLKMTRQDHFDLGQKLQALREEKVLILGSGNIVHNLGLVRWDLEGGYAWADEFDGYMKDCILRRDFKGVIQYKNAGESAKSAFRSFEHFDPLLYILGASQAKDRITVFNDSRTLGSLSMTGYLFE